MTENDSGNQRQAVCCFCLAQRGLRRLPTIGGPWPADAAGRRSNDTTGLMIMNVSSECLVDAWFAANVDARLPTGVSRP